MAGIYAACLKAVELRAGVDALSGAVLSDPASLGLSPADEAALEWAISFADRFGGSVRAVAAGGGGAEAVLRQAAAVGATDLRRVVLEPSVPSEWVAESLAAELGDADLVFCGDVSLDRGSGSVPGFLAGVLGRPQALGLVELELPAAPGEAFTALRRLEGGWRERLLVHPPAVCSVEGSTARLRRARLGSLIEANERSIVSVVGRKGGTAPPVVLGERPYRPPARVVPPPGGETASERLGQLIGLGHEAASARAVSLAPAAAAAMIIESLEAWGEL